MGITNISTRLMAGAACAALLASSTGCAVAGRALIGAAAEPIARHVLSGAAPAAGSPAGALKQIHSPGTVAVDELLAPGQCHVVTVNAGAGLYLPDRNCTPGSIDPTVSQANIGSTICASGYTATVRPPAFITSPLKSASLVDYGEASSRSVEFDHEVPLELGGTNAVSNLWPEPNQAGASGTMNPKDAVENTLRKAVCNRTVTLAAAQHAIATNWTTALKTLGL